MLRFSWNDVDTVASMKELLYALPCFSILFLVRTYIGLPLFFLFLPFYAAFVVHGFQFVRRVWSLPRNRPWDTESTRDCWAYGIFQLLHSSVCVLCLKWSEHVSLGWVWTFLPFWAAVAMMFTLLEAPPSWPQTAKRWKIHWWDGSFAGVADELHLLFSKNVMLLFTACTVLLALKLDGIVEMDVRAVFYPWWVANAMAVVTAGGLLYRVVILDGRDYGSEKWFAAGIFTVGFVIVCSLIIGWQYLLFLRVIGVFLFLNAYWLMLLPAIAVQIAFAVFIFNDRDLSRRTRTARRQQMRNSLAPAPEKVSEKQTEEKPKATRVTCPLCSKTVYVAGGDDTNTVVDAHINRGCK